MHKKKAMTHEKASFVKREGHRVEDIYAELIGVKREKGIGKVDIIDKKGQHHSVKGAQLKWQIFLYGKSRFERDFDESGKLFVNCIESFPENRKDYKKDKNKFKAVLAGNMLKLKEYMENAENRKNFFMKSFLNNEIDYLVIYNENIFHIFNAKEVIDILSNLTTAENSKAQMKSQKDNQKVIFKHDNRTIGEIEMRNDSNVHYKQVKLWMEKKGFMDLLLKHIQPNGKKTDRFIFYGKAQDNFLI